MCRAHAYFFPQAIVQEGVYQATGDSAGQEVGDRSADAVRMVSSAGLLVYTPHRFQTSAPKNMNSISGKEYNTLLRISY